MKFRYKLLITVCLVLLSAVILTFVSSDISVDYCKGTVKLPDGWALLEEKGGCASVIKLGGSGEVTGKANFLLNDPFSVSVRSVHDMFTDDDGNIYFFCTSYRAGNSKREYLYKCDLTFGIAYRLWDLSKIEGYTVKSGAIPQIDGGDIYIPMRKNDETIAILKLSGKEYSVAAEIGIQEDNDSIDRILYKQGIICYENEEGGIYTDGEQVYFPSGDGVCTGMNYDGGRLNFIDTSENAIVSYDINSKEITRSAEKIASVESLQHIMAYSDGSFAAVREDGEKLRAIFHKDKDSIYSVVHGGFLWQTLAAYVVICAIAAGVLMLLYNVLFVRLRKAKASGGSSRYQSIASRITAISTVAGIVCVIVFGILIDDTVTRLNTSLRDSIHVSSSKFFTGYILSNCEIEIKNDTPAFTEESGADYARVTEEYEKALNENSSVECEFILLVKYNGRLYVLPGLPVGSIPAEYVISLRGLDIIANGINNASNVTFADNMTSGLYEYTVSNLSLQDENFDEYEAVICTRSNRYRTRQTGFMLYLWLIAVVVGLVVVLLIVSNIVLYSKLKGLKKLKKAFPLYERDGDPSVFDIKGGDEIAETGQALMLMTEGMQIHTRDISDDNRRYKRFMSAGVLRLMGKSEISKINFGENVRRDCLIMRLITTVNSDVEEKKDLLNSFIENSGGCLLNYSIRKSDICFTAEDDLAEVINSAAGLASDFLIMISFGKVEAGSAGSDKGAWLIGLSSEFTKFERLEKLADGEPKMICLQSAADKLNEAAALKRFELREMLLDDMVCFEVLPMENGVENESETSDNNSDNTDTDDLDTVV